jgi:hypothetical protein
MSDSDTTAKNQTFFMNGVERLLRTVPQESGGFMGEVWVELYDYEFWCPWSFTETATLTKEDAEHMIELHDIAMERVFPSGAISNSESFVESF